MPTNFELDDQIVEKAFALTELNTKKNLVNMPGCSNQKRR